MSDAHTDIARDDKRAEAARSYLDILFDYLIGEQTENQLMEAARQSDAIKRGYHYGRTNFTSPEHVNLVEKLSNSEEEAWEIFLSRITDESLREKFRDISPFRDQ